jgi:hypothetical protein
VHEAGLIAGAVVRSLHGDHLAGDRGADDAEPGLPLAGGIWWLVCVQERFPAQRASSVLGAYGALGGGCQGQGFASLTFRVAGDPRVVPGLVVAAEVAVFGPSSVLRRPGGPARQRPASPPGCRMAGRPPRPAHPRRDRQRPRPLGRGGRQRADHAGRRHHPQGTRSAQAARLTRLAEACCPGAGTPDHGRPPRTHRPQAGTAIRWPRATPPRIPSRGRRNTGVPGPEDVPPAVTATGTTPACCPGPTARCVRRRAAREAPFRNKRRSANAGDAEVDA